MKPFPARSLHMLQEFQIQARRQLRSSLTGGHLMRRRGQSLEFHDYSRYILGDDARHIDWQASTRYPAQPGQAPWENWLIRRFIAEEHMQLVVSIDTRDTMRYPVFSPTGRSGRDVSISKLQAARWLAEAMGIIALRSSDHVVLHRLFGEGGDPHKRVQVFRGAPDQSALWNSLNYLTRTEITGEIFNGQDFFDVYLPPAAVWLIISDFYFEPEKVDALVRLIRRARDGMRWVMLVDMDSWTYETHQMGYGGRAIAGPDVSRSREVEINRGALEKVLTAITANKEKVFQIADHTQWLWEPEYSDQEAFAIFFERMFMNDTLIKSLFMRDM